MRVGNDRVHEHVTLFHNTVSVCHFVMALAEIFSINQWHASVSTVYFVHV